ncbi:MAG: ABC transporter substrate-binding protein [Pseudomonadota bacterium]|nr:ABC transporter substrate-binding protein [Pseudomonadota bacterium]
MPSPKSPSARLLRRRALGPLALAALAPRLTAAQAVGDIVIGQSAPLAGPLGQMFRSVQAGQQLALDEAAAQGGIDGRALKLVALDDGFDPRRTADNVRALVEEQGAIGIFGLVGTEQTAAALGWLSPKRVPLIASYTGSPSLRGEKFPLHFTTQASYIDELRTTVRHLVTVQQTQVGVIYSDDAFGNGMLPVLQQALPAAGATLVGSHSMEPAGGNVAQAAKALAADEPNAVIILAAGPVVVPCVKALRAATAAPLYTISLAVAASTVRALGDEARGLSISRVTPYPWNPRTPLAKRYNALMQAAGKPVDYDHFIGYINARVLLEGLRAAGRDFTPAGLARGMQRLGRLDLGGYVLAFSPTQSNGSRFVDIVMLTRDGKYVR